MVWIFNRLGPSSIPVDRLAILAVDLIDIVKPLSEGEVNASPPHSVSPAALSIDGVQRHYFFALFCCTKQDATNELGVALIWRKS